MITVQCSGYNLGLSLDIIDIVIFDVVEGAKRVEERGEFTPILARVKYPQNSPIFALWRFQQRKVGDLNQKVEKGRRAIEG